VTGGVYYIEVRETSDGGAVPNGTGEANLNGGSYRLTPSLQSSIPGDYDDDDVVDGMDFLVWQRLLGSTSVMPPSPLDSQGFENYQPGALQGQFDWQQLGPSTGSAAIQSTTVRSGSQAVRVDRAPGADNRWGVPLGSALPSNEFIYVTWDMRMTATGAETGAIGPFMGVEAYDDKGAFGLLGSLGVDATTLDVLYQREDDGVLIETGVQVSPDVWHNYAVLFDFVRHEYTVYFEGRELATTGFVDRGNNHSRLDQFTDADISALAAQPDSPSQMMGGTAYFDNFRILDGPRPEFFPADATFDGIVDGLDLGPWRNNFGVHFGQPSGFAASTSDDDNSPDRLEHALSDSHSPAMAAESTTVAASASIIDPSILWLAPRVAALDPFAGEPSRHVTIESWRPLAPAAHRARDLALQMIESPSQASVLAGGVQLSSLGDRPLEDLACTLEGDADIAAEFDAVLTDLAWKR
jgi:hypothetical protein